MDTKHSQLSEILGTSNILPPSTGSSKINVGVPERIISGVGGTLLMFYGLRQKNMVGKLLALAGSTLMARGATGYCPLNEKLDRDTASKEPVAIEITRSLTISASREDLYNYWRNLENLPNFMKHLKDVKQLEDEISAWSAVIPGNLGTLDWKAEVTDDIKDELIAWKSLPGSDVDNAGEVRFKDAPADRGTIVQASISYRAPAGDLGGKIARLFNPGFKQVVKEDLRRFKRLMENGEIPSIENQPSGRA